MQSVAVLNKSPTFSFSLLGPLNMIISMSINTFICKDYVKT